MSPALLAPTCVPLDCPNSTPSTTTRAGPSPAGAPAMPPGLPRTCSRISMAQEDVGQPAYTGPPPAPPPLRPRPPPVAVLPKATSRKANLQAHLPRKPHRPNLPLKNHRRYPKARPPRASPPRVRRRQTRAPALRLGKLARLRSRAPSPRRGRHKQKPPLPPAQAPTLKTAQTQAAREATVNSRSP